MFNVKQKRKKKETAKQKTKRKSRYSKRTSYLAYGRDLHISICLGSRYMLTLNNTTRHHTLHYTTLHTTRNTTAEHNINDKDY